MHLALALKELLLVVLLSRTVEETHCSGFTPVISMHVAAVNVVAIVLESLICRRCSLIPSRMHLGAFRDFMDTVWQRGNRLYWWRRTVGTERIGREDGTRRTISLFEICRTF